MNKACPVVLRVKNGELGLLAFRHPAEGIQLVKGGIKQGETLEAACIRELEEESGIRAQVARRLGVWQPGFKKQVWGLCLMHFEGLLPDTWSFETRDDGGQMFDFFWQPLNTPPGKDWDKRYRSAFDFIRDALQIES